MASSSSTPPRKYEVFLSFRGEDTRHNFVGHLYTALVQKGIVTYMDDHNLEKGQSISPELMKAIEESQFAIIVFSKNYASSTWCLDELAKIMECKTQHGLTVIPIFYDVDPSDVRKQKYNFAESFAKHEANFKDNMEKVKIWKENLFKVGGLTGKDIRGQDEASCISKIVKEIFSKLLPAEPSTKDLVGMVSRKKELSTLLFKEPKVVRFLGIWGMGGIGKTTLARAIFDNFIREFEAGCFLRDVSKKRDMVDLQKILLSKVLRLESVYISDEYEGCRMIKDRLRSKKVLLVLDDVNNLHQLESLVGESKWFGPGSRIIITTRDKHLLNKVDDIYEAHFLSTIDSLQLFCWHAFGPNHPDKDYVDLSNRVVSYARGLPLALKVLGSHLCQQSIDFWESVLNRLKDAPENEIDVVLKITFEGLSDIQKEAFLDIACFFRGCKEDYVKERLHSRGFHPVESITILIQRSLVHKLYGAIEMHDLIQEMGRHIVRQKADMEPRRYSRLWTYKDICDVQMDDTGTAEVKALAIPYGEIKNLEAISLSLKNMKKLRLLDLPNHLREVLRPDGYLPNTLQWLSWPDYEAEYLPKDFQPRNLVHLDLKYSSILETPDVSCMLNLEVLDLFGCKNLLRVHPSIGDHKKLVHVKLSSCPQLKKFDKTLQMESLEFLDLSDCSEFHSFPEIHRNTSRLRTLDLERTNIEELPWSVGGLISLREIKLSNCKQLRALPSSIFGLQHLVFIGLEGCEKLTHFFKKHPKITNSFSSPAESSINRLSRLQVLRLDGCKMLEALPELPSSIKQLHLSDCRALKRIESFNRLSSLEELNIKCCKMLEALTELPSSIKQLHLSDCRALKRIESFNRLSSLKELSLVRCEMLEVLPELPSSIKQLYLDGCTALKRIEIFNHLSSLEELNLLELPSSIKKLYLYGCTALKRIEIFNRLSSLEELNLLELPSSIKKLYLHGCTALKRIESFNRLSSLEELNLVRCEMLEALPELPSSIKKLYLHGCTALKRIESFNRLFSLEELNLVRCEMLEALPELPSRIKKLHLSDCRALKRIKSFNHLSSLEELNIKRYKMLEVLPELPSRIKKLHLYGCRALTRIPSLIDLLGNYEHLQYLAVVDCNQLGSFPSSVSKVLCTRQEVLEVYLPLIEIPEWLNPTNLGQVRVSLSPGWYNDKLGGFALCATNVGVFNFKLCTSNGLVFRCSFVTFVASNDLVFEGDCFATGVAGFWYIPISKIITSDDPDQWKLDQRNDSFLFEVTNKGAKHTSWGIGLVYQGEVDEQDHINTHYLTIAEDYDPTEKYKRSRLKVRVAPAGNES